MKKRIEIKGFNNAMLVIKELLRSGYSVNLPYNISDENVDDEENYFVIEFIFTKYGEGAFIESEEE